MLEKSMLNGIELNDVCVRMYTLLGKQVQYHRKVLYNCHANKRIVISLNSRLLSRVALLHSLTLVEMISETFSLNVWEKTDFERNASWT